MAEMKLYIQYLKEQLINKFTELEDRKTRNYFRSFIGNLADAIVYYQNLPEDAIVNRQCFDVELSKAEVALMGIKETYSFE
jgi:NADH/NAD ratio-sensing transcriptional regulator Rex